MKSEIFSRNKLPFLLIILFVVQASFYSGMYPLWEGWDEPAHFAYIQHIAENQDLPVVGDFMSNEIQKSFTNFPLNQYLLESNGTNYNNFWTHFDIEEFSNNKKIFSSLPNSDRRLSDYTSSPWPIYEVQLPPVGYIFQVPVYLMFYDQDIITRVFALRIFSVLVTAITAIFAYKTISLIFQDRFMRIGSLMFIILNPMFMTNITRVNNESITILLFSIFLYLMILYLKNKTNVTHILIIGLVLGLGLLSKQTFVVAFFLVPIFLFLKYLQIKNNNLMCISITYTLRNLLIIYGISIPIFSWWYYDKVISGNFSGLTSLHGITFNDYMQGFFEIDWNAYYLEVFRHFWGAHGWSFNLLPSPSFEIILFFVGISVIGLIFGVIKTAKKYGLKLFRDWKYQSIFALGFTIFLLILGQSLLNIQMNIIEGFWLVHGWYLFITLTAISMLLFLGFRTIITNSKLKSFQNEFLLMSLIIMFIFNTTTFYWLIPKYYVGL